MKSSGMSFHMTFFISAASSALSMWGIAAAIGVVVVIAIVPIPSDMLASLDPSSRPAGLNACTTSCEGLTFTHKATAIAGDWPDCRCSFR